MKAVVVEKQGQPVVVKDIAQPKAEPGFVIVRNTAIALNPTDWKHAAGVSEDGSTLGCDFAGVIEDPSDSKFSKGDAVAGFAHGGREGRGAAFAEFTKADATQIWKIPSSLNDSEEAAAMGGIAPHTAAQHLYEHHKLPLPDSGKKSDEPFLIWAASTSVGLYAVQLAKLAGCTVIATASPKNFDLLKSLGADDCYSYSDADTPSKISSKYPKLAHALDCVATGDSAKLCSQSLGTDINGGLVTKLLPNQDGDDAGRSNVKVTWDLVYRMLGKSFYMYGDWPADKQSYEFGKKWNTLMTDLVASGKLKSNPLLRKKGGLDNIHEGLDQLKAGKVSAQKITYSL